MASKYLIIDSKFKPFSYDEMIKPVNAATTEHKDIENQYSDLSVKANVWDRMANEEDEPYAHAIYKSYADDLRRQADILAQQGLNPNSRRSLLDMKTRYADDIVPIEQAYTKRDKLIEEQRNAKLRDSTMLFSRDASNLKLEDLMKNPKLAYDSFSGADIQKRAEAASEYLSKVMRSDPKHWEKVMGNQYWQSMVQSGYSPKEIYSTIVNDENAPQELKDIFNKVVASSNIESWDNQDALNQAYYYAGLGLWKSIGTPQSQLQSNKAYDYDTRANIKKGNGVDSDNSTYSTFNHSNIDPKVKTTKLNNNLTFLDSILKDPAKLAIKTTNNSFISYEGVPIARSNAPVIEYNNLNEVKKLADKYGISMTDSYNFNTNMITDKTKFNNNINKIKTAINNEIKTSEIRYKSYTPNITNYDTFNYGIKRNILNRNSIDSGSGVFIYKNGKIKKELQSDEAVSLFNNKDNSITYSIGDGYAKLTSLDDKENNITKAALKFDVLDPNVYKYEDTEGNIVDTGVSELEYLDTQAKYARDNGDIETAKFCVNKLMNRMYALFNSQVKTQTATDSKI